MGAGPQTSVCTMSKGLIDLWLLVLKDNWLLLASWQSEQTGSLLFATGNVNAEIDFWRTGKDAWPSLLCHIW
jgi:hypothetical protein